VLFANVLLNNTKKMFTGRVTISRREQISVCFFAAVIFTAAISISRKHDERRVLDIMHEFHCRNEDVVAVVAVLA
jgi:hypothetical protein